MNAQETQYEQRTPDPGQVVPPALPAAPLRRYAPGLALVLSFFPGLGHLYLGLYQRGVGIFVAFATAIFLADRADVGIFIPFVIFFAVVDAYRSAQALNSGLMRDEEERIKTLSPRRGSLGLGVFLTVVGLILLINQFYPIDFSFLETWWPLILVLGGVWLIARYVMEQKRAASADEPPLP